MFKFPRNDKVIAFLGGPGRAPESDWPQGSRAFFVFPGNSRSHSFFEPFLYSTATTMMKKDHLIDGTDEK